VVVDFNRSGPRIHAVSNVMKARIGDELSLKIVLDGKPLKSQVEATSDGFSLRYNTDAYAAETLEDCPAYVKVNNSGICMVRVEKRIEKTTKDYDLYSQKATSVFAVH
jgi:hypothetical protein